jgi:SEC-C motif-containing protein
VFATGPCPCGGTSYDACCGPLLRGERPAATAEELMRSRYTAYAVGDVDHVWRTWHPRTRPAEVTPDPGLVWRGLTVLRTEAGGPDDDTGVVEFRAEHDSPRGSLHEVSRFERRGGRWFYVAAR